MKPSLALLVAVLALTLAAALPAGGAGAGGPLYTPGISQGYNGVRAPGGDVRYVALWAPSATVVAAIRVRGGRVAISRALRGDFGIPLVAYDGTVGGLSGDGRRLALASYAPAPRTRGTTRFAVLDTKTFRVHRLVTLEGSWSFDAISPNGSTLFLTEHLRAGKNPLYRVRALHVRTRELGRALVDRLEQGQEMGGEPITRASSRDGRWAYTLYARRKDVPFVHALDTARRQAYCIGLPVRVRYNRQWSLRLRLSGSVLAIRHGRKSIATIDVESWKVRRLGERG